MKTKTQTQHTPGPWSLDASWEKNEITAGKFHIAEVGESVRFSEPEARANARLISAAPELLEALKALLAHEGEIEYSGIGTESDSDALEEAKKAAKAAIAKATA